jgi:hypothetical protein
MNDAIGENDEFIPKLLGHLLMPLGDFRPENVLQLVAGWCGTGYFAVLVEQDEPEDQPGHDA